MPAYVAQLLVEKKLKRARELQAPSLTGSGGQYRIKKERGKHAYKRHKKR